MATQGEYDYFKNIGEGGMHHATHKPWSDRQCGLYLMELGAMMGMMPEHGRLLDMGCGTGWTSVLFAKRGYDVVGQDLVPEAIDAGRRLKQQNGLDNLDFVVGDYESLGFKEEFDIVVFFDCLHHAVDEVSALASAYRALKPGGIVVTSEPGRGHERRSAAVVAEFGVTERDMHPAKIVRAAKRVGFRIIPGLGERVIYREMFPAGLTMIDSKAFGSMGLAHVAARQELREMMAALQLPEVVEQVPGVAA